MTRLLPSIPMLAVLLSCCGGLTCASTPSKTNGPGAAVESIKNPPPAPPVPEDAPEGPPPVSVEDEPEDSPASLDSPD